MAKKIRSVTFSAEKLENGTLVYHLGGRIGSDDDVSLSRPAKGLMVRDPESILNAIPSIVIDPTKSLNEIMRQIENKIEETEGI